MSEYLWRYYLENDVERFRQFLAQANYTGTGPGNAVFKIGSPSGLATSPRTPFKSRKTTDIRTPGSYGKGTTGGQLLTRTDLNFRDANGCTILHHAATASDNDAYGFVQALLDVPFIDLYIQDAESGWTALHRALYFGNIAAAQAIMLRDVRDATDYTSGLAHTHMGGLIKIKDHEGNSPFEVFGLTVASRDLHRDAQTIDGRNVEDDDSSVGNGDTYGDEEGMRSKIIKPRINLHGDEVFMFGSNKNLTLGVGDEDDRQFPERPPFERPEHLLHRFHQDLLDRQANVYEAQDLGSSQLMSSSKDDLPAVIKHQPLKTQDIVMSKLSTAIITADPESNLFMTGFGPGGRLGTGDEATRFKLVCIETGGLSGKKVVSVALGQDHTIAISDKGEVFTWGNNKFGQLGYSLPTPAPGQDVPMQLVPRQLFGSMKKEMVLGAAASAIHSAIFTNNALYTFGKNDGQLGLMDADARSLEIQQSPRRVGANLLQSPIQAVSAIDEATIILLESHDVVVMTHYGWTKVVFPLGGFDRHILTGTTPSQRYISNVRNHITKVTAGGNTICALSAFGEVFTVDVAQRHDARSASTSTTHPVKARNALPPPLRVWSIRKSHMAARDVAVGQHGSIILCTEAGSVWRKEKRTKLKNTKSPAARAKDYKFVRVPTLTRAIAVRSNAFGAFASVRKDTDVTREQVDVDPPTLWTDLLPLLPFRNFQASHEESDDEYPGTNGRAPVPLSTNPEAIKQALILSKDPENEIQDILRYHEPISDSSYDVWIVSNVTDVRIPVHAFMLATRSNVLRRAFNEFQQSYYFSIPDVASMEYGKDGQIQLLFNGADFYTLVNLVLYIYCDAIVDIWHYTRRSPESAARYRQIRRELMDISQKLEMKGLERAARLQVDPGRRLHLDMELAFADEDYFIDGDIAIQLAGDVELKAHSALVCLRCPFFEAMFYGRAAGKWVASRRDTAADAAETVKVDLKHIEPDIFTMALRHIYADTGEELFDEVVTKDLDEFLDVVLEVMSVANELMLDRLAQISQRILGRHINIRNVCHLLNAVAPCTVDEFKKVALEYICLNLEVMLENRLLEELDEDLLVELDTVVQSNQIEHSLIARSGKADEELLEAHPELVEQLELGRQRKIDSMRLKTRLYEDEDRSLTSNRFRVGSVDKSPSLNHRPNTTRRETISPGTSPALRAKASTNDLLFDMDDEETTEPSSPQLGSDIPSPSIRPRDLDDFPSRTLKESDWTDVKGKSVSRSIATTLSSVNDSSMSRSKQAPAAQARSASSQPLSTTTGFVTTSKPWAAAPTAEKTDLKDIMSQTSSSHKISSLSTALNSSHEETARPSFPGKMSQKERKKMLEQQRQVLSEEKQKPSPKPWTPESDKPHKSSSPWKAVRAPSAPAVTDISNASASTPPTRQPGRPNMTLRQTVAGTPPIAEATSPATSPALPKSTASGARPSPQPNPSSNTSLSQSQAVTPQIQSIRHTPRPSPSSFQATSKTSLVEILNQQASEKIAITEARTAKRSLQDIQAEQEFQAWWDQESKKAMAEEEALQRAEKASTFSRGRGGKRGGGRGGGHSSGKERVGRGGNRGDTRHEPNGSKPTNATAPPDNRSGQGLASKVSGTEMDRPLSLADSAPSTPQPSLHHHHHHHHPPHPPRGSGTGAPTISSKSRGKPRAPRGT